MGEKLIERFSGVRGLNFTKNGEDIGRSWRSGDHKKFVSEFGYLAAFSKTCGIKLSELPVMLKRRQISHFLSPAKISRGLGEISIPIVEALPTT